LYEMHHSIFFPGRRMTFLSHIQIDLKCVRPG